MWDTVIDVDRMSAEVAEAAGRLVVKRWVVA
jgi:hypothetical protein